MTVDGLTGGRGVLVQGGFARRRALPAHLHGCQRSLPDGPGGSQRGTFQENEAGANQKLILQAIAREWSKWEEFKATTALSQSKLEAIRKLSSGLRIIGTLRLLTLKFENSRT